MLIPGLSGVDFKDKQPKYEDEGNSCPDIGFGSSIKHNQKLIASAKSMWHAVYVSIYQILDLKYC